MTFSLTHAHAIKGAFFCEGTRNRRKSSKRVFVRPGANADDENEEERDPVRDAFEKLYAPNTGKRIKYGVFQETLSASEKNKYTDAEKTKLRAKASEELTVIDDEERKRRGWFWFWFSRACSSNPFRSRFSFFYSPFTQKRAE